MWPSLHACSPRINFLEIYLSLPDTHKTKVCAMKILVTTRALNLTFFGEVQFPGILRDLPRPDIANYVLD